ncbi:hypothetical protein OSH10_08320 [Kaistia defluvii]|uniref:hypothetical protein n=1 Tax=Kaistia defluvii TaxID=410841 RepID=UPI00225BF41D|nr:hypothetical protein [Kaistia defluvii]MCX5518438.1 hypothetical protein [Kaistia defluvii]
MQLFYHDDDGRITGGVSGAFSPDDLDDLRTRGFSFLVVPDRASMTTNYVVEGQLVPRPVADIRIDRIEIPADKRSKVKITGLPVPCVVQIDDQALTVDDGMLELTAEMPAAYWVSLDCFPYMPWSAEITVT